MKELISSADQQPIASVNQYAEFQVVGYENLVELEKLWSALGMKAGGPMEQFDWAVVAAEFTTASAVEIAGIMRGGALSAIVPFAIKRVAGIPRRVMLGVDEYSEPMDFLFTDSEARNCLFRTLARDRRPLLLPRLPAEDGAFETLRNVFKTRSFMLERSSPSSPFLSLNTSWCEPEQHLNARRRSDLRRMQRHLEGMGKVTTDIIVPTPEQLPTLLDEAFVVEARSWKGTAGTALLYDKKRQSHFRKYLLSRANSGQCHIGFLRVDGKPIAMQLAIEHMDALWLLKIGYDATYAHCSPGQILLRAMIAYSARLGLKRFEFLGMNEPWIDVWSPEEHTYRSVRIYPFSILGAMAFSTDAVTVATRLVRKHGRMVHSLLQKKCMSLLKRSADSGIVGRTLADALHTAEKLRGQGLGVAIGFWNLETHTTSEIAQQVLVGVRKLASHSNKDDYLSLRLSALQFNKELLHQLAAAAEQVDCRLHMDSDGIEHVMRGRAVCEELRQRYPQLEIGFTLPGRWERSVADADWACHQNLFVRVVKGHWPDPAKIDTDVEKGFMQVIESLAGRARRVAVATHDPSLALSALQRLRATDTPCELELFYGLPIDDCLQVARDLSVPVRIYIPYGAGVLVEALSYLRREPRQIRSLVKTKLVGHLTTSSA